MDNATRLMTEINRIIAVEPDELRTALAAADLEIHKTGMMAALFELIYCAIKVQPLIDSFDELACLGPEFEGRFEMAILEAMQFARVQPSDADWQWAEEAIKAIVERSERSDT